MSTFAVGCLVAFWIMFVLWMMERSASRYWRWRAEEWKKLHGTAAAGWDNSHALARFWMEQALRSPFHAKPKEVPRA